MRTPPTFEIFRFKALPELTLVSTQFKDHRSAPHAHDELAFGLCDDGLTDFHCVGHRGRVPKGSIIAIDAEQIHWDQAGNGRIRMIYASPSLFGIEPLAPVKPVFHDPLLWEAAEKLFRSTEKTIPGNWRRFVLLAQVLGRLGPRRSRKRSALLERLTEGDFTLKSLAATEGLSPSAYLRAFRREHGCTPHEYSRQVRILRAAQRIREGIPIAEAAVEQGFFDQSHFHRHFLGIFSVSPGVFRRHNSVQSSKR